MTPHLPVDIAPADVRDPLIQTLLETLTAELALGGYTAEQTFGYSPRQLEQSEVYLVAARVAGTPVGVGGVELQDGGRAELKRFFVAPEHRGAGVADALIEALVIYAVTHRARVAALETGDQQLAALAFYRRHGFIEVPRFAPYLTSETSVCMERQL